MRCLPVFPHDRRLQRRVAGPGHLVVRPRLAGRVGHIGMDLKLENRFFLFGDGRVGFCGKPDGEAAVVVGQGVAVSDRLALTGVRPVPARPPTPDREPHLAFHPPFDRRPTDRRAAVGRCLAGHRHRRPEPRCFLWPLDRYLELRALVFLDVERGPAARPVGSQVHPPHHPVARCGEHAIE